MRGVPADKKAGSNAVLKPSATHDVGQQRFTAAHPEPNERATIQLVTGGSSSYAVYQATSIYIPLPCRFRTRGLRFPLEEENAGRFPTLRAAVDHIGP